MILTSSYPCTDHPSSQDANVVSGYLYAVLLAVSTFAGSLFSCHFNLLMTELGIKVRGALTTAVYDKVGAG